MGEPSRYSVDDEVAGLSGGVLQNKFGITDQSELEDTESVLFADAYQYFFTLLEDDQLLLYSKTIFDIHRYTLDPLYDWAGELRTVDISKDGVLFAPVVHLQQSVQHMNEIIDAQIPTSQDTIEAISKKLAVIHNEFIAVHPFREGNGRTIRLFMDLAVVNCGYQPIDYTQMDSTSYISACVAGMSEQHELLEKILQPLIQKM